MLTLVVNEKDSFVTHGRLRNVHVCRETYLTISVLVCVHLAACDILLKVVVMQCAHHL